MMKKVLCLIYLCCFCVNCLSLPAKEYHVSMVGDDSNNGSEKSPFRTIARAAREAYPGDVVTVHAGVYRERVIPPRGGVSDEKRIVYQAAPGEIVVITGSEPVTGWQKVQNDTWKLTLPDSFFGEVNPFDEQIYGSWYHGKGNPNHTGSVYLDGKRIQEAFSFKQILEPIDGQPYWYAETDGNGGPVLMNLGWICPAGGEKMTSVQASVEGGDQAICYKWGSPDAGWPFGYLEDGSVMYFDDVDFGKGTDSLSFEAATLVKESLLEVRLGNANGELLGTYLVTNTGDWETFSVFHLKMARKLSGKNDICLVVKAPKAKENGKTTIWAQFPKGMDPNNTPVEISVRPQVFYPDKTGIDYITVRGFILENAATNWASPSAEQPGLIGPRWSKGWIIEDNIIRNSRCSGISLGRPTFGHSHHYQELPPRVYADPDGGQTVEELLDYFENASWKKEAAGFHVIRNNHIYACGQAGIVGCSGGAFCRIEGNEIHDICMGETFTGEEVAGIKLHFANDVVLKNNHIYRTIRGLWLDWGGQGAQVIGNLFHDNDQTEDIFIEVCHGPILLANNILLSKTSLNIGEGVACVHNLARGTISAHGDGRHTYFYKPHGTVSAGKIESKGGDLRWYNNLLMGQASFGNWKEFHYPVKYDGNVFLEGAVAASSDKTALTDSIFQPDLQLEERADGWYLSMNVSPDWQKHGKRKFVTTAMLGKAVVPQQEFTDPDGSPLKVSTDYLGKKRKKSAPFPSPIEVEKPGKQEWKIWPRL